MVRRIAGIATAAFLALAGAGTAQASTVSVVGGELRYEGGAGEFNFIEAYESADDPSMVTVVEYEAELVPGVGCAPLPDPLSVPYLYLTTTCVGVTAGAVFEMGDEYDELFSALSVPTTADGGAGDDYLSTGNGVDTVNGGAGDDGLDSHGGADKLDGGDGNDVLIGDRLFYAYEGEEPETPPEPAADVLSGGSGDDRLYGGVGADTISGGDGRDQVSYAERAAPVTVSLDGAPGDGEAGENDSVAADVEGASTGSGNDRVTGGAAGGTFSLGGGDDVLTAGPGDDLIWGGEGVDALDAGPGADAVHAAEEGEEGEKMSADRVTCGDGPDTATLDSVDVAGPDCETIDRTAPAAAPPLTPVQALVPPAALAPAGLELRRVKVRGRRGARTVKLAGRLLPPAGADPKVCTGLGVRVELRDKRRVRARRVVLLGADCAFKATLKRKRRARLTAKATFTGSSALLPVASAGLKVR